MIEQVFKISRGDEKVIERVILDENLNYIHMVFAGKDGLQEHYTNSNLYMTVVRGTLSIALGDQESHDYPDGTVIVIPDKTKMNVKNLTDEVLELIIVKVPAPM